MNAKVLYQITRLSVTANVGNHKNGIYLVADQLLKGKQMPGGGKITKAKVPQIPTDEGHCTLEKWKTCKCPQ